MIKINVKCEEKCGCVRPLHGMNLAAPISNARISKIVSDDLRMLNIPITRMHDAPWNNPGMRLVDIPCVFPIFEADHHNPANYYFAQTDDYFANAYNHGAKIMYRLGVSIEHSAGHYWTSPPADYKKWAEIGMKIIEHYPEIVYWEIWNEADTELPLLWNGTWQQFIEFYVTTATLIKNRFPHLKIGGPSMASIKSGNGKHIRSFLKECQRCDAPLDFFTYHQYSDKPEKIIASPARVKNMLDHFGFTNTEIHLAEWHYHPGWGSDCTPEQESAVSQMMQGIDAAVYLGSVLAGWQSTPLTMGEYYTGSTGSSGYGLFKQNGMRTPSFYALDFFNQVCRNGNAVITESSDSDTRLAASVSEDKVLLMASAFKTAQNQVKIEFPGISFKPESCVLTVLDNAGVPRVINQDIIRHENGLTFEKSTGSIIIFVKLLLHG